LNYGICIENVREKYGVYNKSNVKMIIKLKEEAFI
jgi:hypothetical protein